MGSITKEEIANSKKKYYKFFFDKKVNNNHHWISIAENGLTTNIDAVDGEGIFFAEEKDIMKWFAYGNTVVEVLFDKNNFNYKDLPNEYQVENGKYSGQAILAGEFIHVNSEKMYQFIIAHIKDLEGDFSQIQNHLLLIRGFETLKQLWDYKYAITGKIDDEKQQALERLKAYAFTYYDVDANSVLNCRNLEELIQLLSEDKWNFYNKN